MTNPRIAIIVGSNRRESINRKLAQALAKLAAPQLDVAFVRIDDLPMYNQDMIPPLPPQAVRFKREIAGADGVLFVTPEHNRSLPAVLKNAIDWGGPSTGENSWAGKPVFLTGASPGAIGTALSQQHLRQILGSFLGALVLGGEAYVTFKPELIDEQGQITDDSTRKFLQGFIDRFAVLVTRLAPGAERSAA
jgi:chromate reductase